MIFKVKIYDLTEIFKETKSKLVKSNIDNGAKVYGIKLDKMNGMIGFEILPNRRIGTEFSDIAKKFGLNGILHSDELPNYGISEEEVKNVKKMLNCSDEDAFILLISKDYEVAKKVFNLIINRINESIKGIPKDTRQANDDGTTSFLRPQPGSERMYPETDHPYIYIDKDVIENNEYKIIRYKISYGDVKETFDIYYLKKFDKDLYIRLLNEGKTILNSIDPEFVKQMLKSFGYNEKQIENIIWSEYINDIIKISFDIDPTTVYYLFFQMVGDAENLFKEKIEKFDLNFVYKIKDYLKDKKIVKNAVPIIYYHYIKYNKDIKDIIRENNLYKRNREELKKEIMEYIKSLNTNDKKVIFSNVFSKFKYVADSDDIKKVLEEILNI